MSCPNVSYSHPINNWYMESLIISLQDKDQTLIQRIELLYTFIDQKVDEGWNRKQMYSLCIDLLNNYDMEEGVINPIYEYLTILIGDCAPSSIVRFKDEPEKEEDLTDYVRSFIWIYAD